VKRIVCVVAAGALALAGCSSSKNSTGGSSTSGSSTAAALSGSINVDAASSLTEAFTALKAAFAKAHPGTTVNITYGASSDLQTQIQQGAPAQVFASASEKNMTALGPQAVKATDFAKNTLEIAVPPSNPGNVTSVDDLAKSGVKVAVCDPAVPCGAVAAQVFTNAKITVHPKASLADVKSTLAAVESGEVDAGLVYVTDVRAAGAKVKGVQIPADVNASTTYPISVLEGAQNAALAQAFVDYVLSEAGSAVLTRAGFVLP
jgi:molybdate transport system substrate-binding protein